MPLQTVERVQALEPPLLNWKLPAMKVFLFFFGQLFYSIFFFDWNPLPISLEKSKYNSILWIYFYLSGNSFKEPLQLRLMFFPLYKRIRNTTSVVHGSKGIWQMCAFYHGGFILPLYTTAFPSKAPLLSLESRFSKFSNYKIFCGFPSEDRLSSLLHASGN